MRRLASLRIVIGFLSALCLSLAAGVAAHGSESAELAHTRAGSTPDRSLAVPVKSPARKAFRTSLESLEARRMLSAAVQGLTAEYYPTQNLTGTPTTRVDANVSFNWGMNAPIAGMPKDRFSVRWRGEIQADFSELYTFIVNGDEGMRVWINRQLIIDAWGSNKSLTKSGTIRLEAGQRYEIQIDFFDRKDQALIHLYWSSASQPKSLVPTAALYPMLSPSTLDPHWISNRIEMEDFDYTGNLVGYFDTTLGNTGGQYRSTNVDIGQSGDTGGGYHIGWTSPGEWLNYSVNVPTTGTYLLNMRVASSGLGGTFHVELNGTDVSGAISVPDTGGWSTWQTITVGNIALSAGIHSLRIVMDTAGASGYVGNFNWMQFSPAVVETEVPNITVFSGGTQIQNGQLVPLTFPTTYQGDPGPSLTFLVINDGTAELVLSSPTVPAGFLLVEGLVSSLAPGASDTFTVQLNTAQPGAYSGNLSIASNDPGTPQFQFSVAGEVIVLSSGESRILVPGSGWTGPTEQPPANGTGQGADAMAIARWDVVPYQTFDGQFNVGVVAFHMNGIQKVSFSVDGGEWIDVTTPTLNTQVGGNGWDGVVEYWATLDASLFTSSGQIELRAIAYPTVGVPRVLDPLLLNVNISGAQVGLVRYVSLTGDDTTGDGSLESPFRTIKKAAFDIQNAQGGRADDGIIYLLSGDHEFTGTTNTSEVRTENSYLTIAGAPGLSPDSVRITVGGSGQRLNATLLRLHNLTLAAVLVNNATLSQPAHIWLDGVVGTRYNRFESLTFSGFQSVYATDSTFTDLRKGIGGTLARNVRVQHVGEDGFFNPVALINVSVDDVNRTGWEQYLPEAPHPDVVQWYSGGAALYENRIIYGLRSSNVVGSQGVFFKGGTGMIGKDIAIINAAVQADNNQWHMPLNHLVVWQSSFSHNFIFRDSALLSAGQVRNVSLRNSVFGSLTGVDAPAYPVVFDNNHFITGAAWGTRATTGNPLWTATLVPQAGSPLLDRVTDVLIEVDADGNPLTAGSSIGAVQPA